jgi:hypothetical protein
LWFLSYRILKPFEKSSSRDETGHGSYSYLHPHLLLFILKSISHEIYYPIYRLKYIDLHSYAVCEFYILAPTGLHWQAFFVFSRELSVGSHSDADLRDLSKEPVDLLWLRLSCATTASHVLLSFLSLKYGWIQIDWRLCMWLYNGDCHSLMYMTKLS